MISFRIMGASEGRGDGQQPEAVVELWPGTVWPPKEPEAAQGDVEEGDDRTEDVSVDVGAVVGVVVGVLMFVSGGRGLSPGLASSVELRGMPAGVVCPAVRPRVGIDEPVLPLLCVQPIEGVAASPPPSKDVLPDNMVLLPVALHPLPMPPVGGGAMPGTASSVAPRGTPTEPTAVLEFRVGEDVKSDELDGLVCANEASQASSINSSAAIGGGVFMTRPPLSVPVSAGFGGSLSA
jgi:hypothetical protein